MPYLSSRVLCVEELFLATCMLPFPLVQWLSAPLWWIFNKGLFLSPSEELIKVIEARADEPHHPDLETQLPPHTPPHNYTCIIRTHIYTHTHVCTRTYTWRQCAAPLSRVLATFPPVLEPLDHLGAATVLSMHWDIITRWREGGGYNGEMIFIFQLDNHSSVQCWCIGFFCSVCVFVSFISLSPSTLFSASLRVSATHVMASVQKQDDLVFGDVVHANDLSVKAAYSNMTA